MKDSGEEKKIYELETCKEFSWPFTLRERKSNPREIISR